jgi:DNA polymerase-3 subunit alpha
MAEPTDLVHLHVHTIFSPLDGIASPEDYAERCKELEMPAMAITDHGSMASFPDAYLAFQKHGVKFIPGCEAYYNDYHLELKKFQASGITWASLKKTDEERWGRMRRQRHITVLAKNQTGYKNLIHMTSDAWEIGFYYKPRIWMDILDKYREGLIILTGCLNGPLCFEVREAIQAAQGKDLPKARRHLDIARDWLARMKEIFGDDLYVELQMPGLEVEFSAEAFRKCARLSDEFEVKSVITNDCHYITRDDFEVQRCMMAVDQNMTIDDPNLFQMNSDEQFFKTRAQLRETFLTLPYGSGLKIDKFEESCDNTIEVAEKCEGFEPDLSPKLPSIPDANKKLTLAVINELKRKGLYDDLKKYHMDGQMVTHREQVTIELKRIISKGFASYFLITQDLVKHSLDKGCDVGPARGSAGGSLVCYLLGIHELNPLKWGLSFTRFMSPSRGGYLLNVSLE